MRAPSQVGRCLTSFSTQQQGATMATSVSVFPSSLFCISVYQFHFISGMYFDHPEIVPDGLLGDFRFNKGDEAVAR